MDYESEPYLHCTAGSSSSRCSSRRRAIDRSLCGEHCRRRRGTGPWLGRGNALSLRFPGSAKSAETSHRGREPVEAEQIRTYQFANQLVTKTHGPVRIQEDDCERELTKEPVHRTFSNPDVPLRTPECGFCTVGVARLAAGIYRRAILRTGRRVQFREILSRTAA